MSEFVFLLLNDLVIESIKILGASSIAFFSNKTSYIFKYELCLSLIFILFKDSILSLISSLIFLNSFVFLAILVSFNFSLTCEIDISSFFSFLLRSFINSISSFSFFFFSTKNLSAQLLKSFQSFFSYCFPAVPIANHSFFNLLNSLKQ